MKPKPMVVTCGEALLRLSPPAGELLTGARQLSVHVGGAEANVAAGLASLGIAVRWFSRVNNAATGDAVLGELKSHGVDTSFTARAEARTGLYFLEHGEGPRPASVIYDRAGSAFAGITQHDADTALSAGLLAGSSAFVTSGITLALGAGPAAAVKHIWDAAAGQLRVFDVNYRASLSDPIEAADAALPFLTSCDLVFVAERDALALFGTADLSGYAGQAVTVMTRGSDGAQATGPDGVVHSAAALPVGSSGRIGRGDAFVAGFMAGTIRGQDTAQSLRLAVASASYKSSLAGDLARLDRSAIEALAQGDATGDVMR